LSAARPVFAGVLFFPVTPFTKSGAVDLDALARHIANGLDAGPGGVFIACGTGEFHALDPQEFEPVVRTAVEVVAGRLPVYAGAGGSIAQAKQFAKAAKDAGADGLLLLPPYLVEMPQAGLVAFVRDVAATTDLPVIVYNRNNVRQRAAHRRPRRPVRAGSDRSKREFCMWAADPRYPQPRCRNRCLRRTHGS
jgi:5-dehydro-4-deoxyglucarate dehydratase